MVSAWMLVAAMGFDHWKEPGVFRPERHSNEEGTQVIGSDYIYWHWHDVICCMRKNFFNLMK